MLPRMIAFVTVIATFEVAPSSMQPPVAPTSQPQRQPQTMVDIPLAIKPAEFEMYAELMSVSVGQRDYLAQLFESYCDTYKAIGDKDLPGVRDLADAARAARTAGADFHSTQWNAFKDAEEQLRKKLDQCDQRFFADVQSLLAEAQIPELDRVKNHRTRQKRSRASHQIPAAGIDLQNVLYDLSLESAQSPEVGQIMREYDQSITPLVSNAERTRRRESPKIQWLNAQIRDAGQVAGSEARALAAELSEQRTLLMSKRSRDQQRIADRNDLFVRRISDLLTEGDATRLLREYDRLAYPGVLPDITSPMSIVERILLQPEVAEESRAILSNLTMSYEQSVDSVTSQLREAFSDWKAEYAATGSSKGYAEYVDATGQLLSRLLELHEGLMKQVEPLVPPEVWGQANRERIAWQSVVQEMRAKIASKNFPSP